MKNLKVHIIKFVAVFMSVMYFVSPLKSNIVDIMHKISHHISQPSFVLSHDTEFNLENKFSLKSISEHEHNFINVFEDIFSLGFNEKDNNLPMTKDLKIDKHMYSSKIKIDEMHSFKLPLFLFFYSEKLQICALKKRKIPPQLD